MAEAAFACAAPLAQDRALARYELGLIQFSSRRTATGLVTWHPLFGLPVADPLGHFVRGFEALARDSFDEAIAHYREGLACNDINQAMASDIARVVEAVEKLPAEPAPPAMPEPDGDARHVLLAGYARRLH